MRLFFSMTGLFLMQMAMAQQIDYKGFPQWSWGKRDSTEYYLYTPDNLQKETKYPLMLFLHGCCGKDYHATLRNAVDPPVRLWHDLGKNRQSIPTYILSPKTSAGWRQHFENLKAVIDSLIRYASADPQRIYISGFSMGAQGTWEFIEKYPDYFAAAVPMGMDFKGKDLTKFAKLPIWAIRGDKDWWARHLGTQIKAIRSLTIDNADSSEWHSGVNPRLTNFEGMGHVVMWPAVRELDIKSWVYSKVNDGNQYPTVVLRTPSNIVSGQAGEKFSIRFEAIDHDGKISSLTLVESGASRTLPTSAKSFDIVAKAGDHPFELKVTDDKGKFSIATGILRSDIPVKITSSNLPPIRAGEFFSTSLHASGNGSIRWTANGSLPVGVRLSKEGLLSGIAQASGKFEIEVTGEDETNDKETRKLKLRVQPKTRNSVIVSNVINHNSETLPLSIVAEGMSPHIRGDDEVTLSGDPGKFAGLTMIMTHPGDTVAGSNPYLRFTVDEDVTVYVAYEKLDNLHRSTIPEWLKEYQPEGELTAQYYYYNVYSKDFSKGEIALPDPERKRHGINNNYFVMVKKKEKR